MDYPILFHNIGKLYTPEGTTAKRGSAMREINFIPNAAILVGETGLIQQVGTFRDVTTNQSEFESIDCKGLTALPGFVDSHTHAVFIGDRALEFGMRARGKTYEEIAAKGGGILNSVEHVRNASSRSIADFSRKYILSALSLGTTLMEIKSGYGLSLDAELTLLEAAELLSEQTSMEIVRTFLGAHAVPDGKSQEEYVDEIVYEHLPAIAKSRAAEFCDVFMDEGYFTRESTVQIFEAAKKHGLKLRLHADELANTEAASLACAMGAFSADHLLKVSNAGIEALAQSKRTIATLLPITALSLRANYAPARRLIDRGAAVAIASDCNPGSSMSENMQFVMTLAVIGMQMTVEEALTAATLNGAAALGRSKTNGSIERNKAADIVFYDIPSLDYLPYHIAVSDIVSVVKGGKFVSGENL